MKQREFSHLLELWEKIVIYIFDFDNTIAHTFLYVPHSDRDLVAEAYVQALVHIWGSYALELLEAVDGLQNRAPGELISAILEMEETSIPGKGRQRLITLAKNSFTENFISGKSRWQIMSEYVPSGKGFSWEWDKKNPEKTITEFLVRAKLHTLLFQIGPHYPTPCPGFKLFYQRLLKPSSGSDPIIIPGIISSGHEIFIQKTFDTWKLPCPELVLTDDDMRGSDIADIAKASKPNPILLDMLLKNWLKKQKVKLSAKQFEKFKTVVLKQIIYFGDDPNKDGNFAKNSGVRFGHFNPELDPRTRIGLSNSGNFVFYDWREVPEILGLT